MQPASSSSENAQHLSEDPAAPGLKRGAGRAVAASRSSLLGPRVKPEDDEGGDRSPYSNPKRMFGANVDWPSSQLQAFAMHGQGQLGVLLR